MNNIPENINLVLQKFINGVQEILGDNLEKIILYGSYARGDYNASSDIDIMILTNLDNEELEEYKTKIWDYSYDIEEENNFEIKLSSLIKNINDYEERVNVVPCFRNVQREGVALING